MILAAALFCFGCGEKRPAPEERPEKQTSDVSIASRSQPRALANVSRNQFLERGNPTFVLGTGGDDVADHRIATQVALLRSMALPESKAVFDDAIDVGKGPSGWPANPVLYGGAHENSVVAALAPSLPFVVSADKIEIGGKVYQGDGYRLIVVVPARAADESGPGYPEFLLFAGTGPGGIAEINAGLPGGAPILVADAFGGLVAGSWMLTRDGTLSADVSLAPGRRIAYRLVERQLASADSSHAARISFQFPAMLDAHPDEVAVIDACMRGLQTVVRKLKIANPVPLSVYVYPDRRSKKELSGNEGQGHAVPSARALHILQLGGSDIVAMESLVAHEGTHVLGYYAWGPAGSALMGEGLAVWVSNTYQGKSLEAWKAILARGTTVETLLKSDWSKLSEAETYPLAGILVDELIKAVGPEPVRTHLLGASNETWSNACAAAGTSSDAVEASLANAIPAPAP